ncbi:MULTISPECIES: hypothetical protein [unclassified Caballeronia]|uniref:hypothetical protein n=1 Tax=unclassified Caballeronia TaxID=2646786 RepID=UPI002028F10D|nr:MULTISPECIES: hypothetical protein [unclassified Caballeronia]MDR5768099.1 hypothetical protein [Caballeronia sp. LZ028]
MNDDLMSERIRVLMSQSEGVRRMRARMIVARIREMMLEHGLTLSDLVTNDQAKSEDAVVTASQESSADRTCGDICDSSSECLEPTNENAPAQVNTAPVASGTKAVEHVKTSRARHAKTKSSKVN